MQEKAAVYLDSNAGAPLKPAVLEALRNHLNRSQNLGNPSSIHSEGRRARKILAQAREDVAFSLGKSTDSEQIVFTSSGSEANQLAIRSALEPALLKGLKPHWLTTAGEHDSTRQMMEWFKARGGTVTLLPLSADGVVELPDADHSSWDQWLTPDTALVSLIWVNNETGAITDFQKSGLIARLKRCNIPLHIDAVQAWGKLPFDVDSLGAQWVSLSGHKIGALGGVGALWVATSRQGGRGISPAILGKQEKSRRGGTENLMGALSMGVAARGLDPLQWDQRVRPIRDRLETVICERIKGTVVNGQGARRIGNTLSLSFDQVEGDSLVMALDMAGYCVSSGSACASGVLEPSHVLMAMGRSSAQAMAALRISLTGEPDDLTWKMLENFVQALEHTVARVRKSKF